MDSYQQLTCSKLSSVCACYSLKEDNFVDLHVVYETENSKLIVILRAEVRIFKNKYNVDGSLQRLLSHASAFSTQFLIGIFAARAVLK